MGNLWTTRVSGDGIAALGWQPCACWRRAGLMIISCGSVGFCEKKGFLRPGVRYCATVLSIAGPYPTTGALTCGGRSRASRFGLRYE